MSQQPAPPDAVPGEAWELPVSNVEPPPARTEAARVADGYRDVPWGTSATEFERLKGVRPGAMSREIVAPLPGDPAVARSDAVWGDAVAAVLGAPPELSVRALPAQFSSAYVPSDEAHYLFFDGRLIGALVEVGAQHYDLLKTALKKRAKPRGSLARVVATRDGRPGGTVVADAFANGGSRVFLGRFQYAPSESADLVTSVRVIYLSSQDCDRLGRTIQRATLALRRTSAADHDGPERDLSKLQ
jgi:hypothetical protein